MSIVNLHTLNFLNQNNPDSMATYSIITTQNIEYCDNMTIITRIEFNQKYTFLTCISPLFVISRLLEEKKISYLEISGICCRFRKHGNFNYNDEIIRKNVKVFGIIGASCNFNKFSDQIECVWDQNGNKEVDSDVLYGNILSSNSYSYNRTNIFASKLMYEACDEQILCEKIIGVDINNGKSIIFMNSVRIIDAIDFIIKKIGDRKALIQITMNYPSNSLFYDSDVFLACYGMVRNLENIKIFYPKNENMTNISKIKKIEKNVVITIKWEMSISINSDDYEELIIEYEKDNTYIIDVYTNNQKIELESPNNANGLILKQQTSTVPKIKKKKLEIIEVNESLVVRQTKKYNSGIWEVKLNPNPNNKNSGIVHAYIKASKGISNSKIVIE